MIHSKTISNFILVITIIFFALGCKKEIEKPVSDNELGLDDRIISISDSSSFKQAAFLNTFSQIAILENDDEWLWKLSHKAENGQLISTSQNNRFFSDFGMGLFQYNYEYNNEEVIIKANRERAFNMVDFNEYTFEYDLQGRISRYQLEKTYSLKTATVFYNDQDKVIEIEFSRIDNGAQSPYTYKYIVSYTADGDLFKIIEDDSSNEKVSEFGYENQNLHYVKRYSLRNGVEQDVYYDIYKYDSDNRASKAYMYRNNLEINDSKSFISYQYQDDKMIAESIGYEGETRYKTEYGEKLLKLSYTQYFYNIDFELSTFQYAIKNTYENFKIVKKEYFEGTYTNLDLIAYSTLTIVDETNTSIYIRQDFYSMNDVLVYYVIYENDYSNIRNLIWYNTEGVEIESSLIDIEWPFKLIFENIY